MDEVLGDFKIIMIPPAIPQSNTNSQPSVRFGWWQVSHESINTGALNQLPSSLWQDYLGSRISRINYMDDLQDVFERGEKHFINLESKANRWLLNDPSAYPTWKSVKARFTKMVKKILELQWTQKATPLPEGPHVIHSVSKAYKGAVTTLQKLLNASDLTPKAQEHLKMDLDEYLGKLMHYVGDIYMPLHTTQYFDWKILANKGIHEFIEGELLSSQDYQEIMKRSNARTEPIPVLKADELTPFITQAIRHSHLKLFEIVAIHQGVKQAFPSAGADKTKQELDERLTPLASEQILRAQTALASILQLVHTEASKPLMQTH